MEAKDFGDLLAENVDLAPCFDGLLADEGDFASCFGGRGLDLLRETVAVHGGVVGVDDGGVPDALGANTNLLGAAEDGVEEVVDVEAFEGAGGFAD